MTPEFSDFNRAREVGMVVVSYDSRFPNARILGEDWIVEQRGSADLGEIIRNGRTSRGNSFSLSRCVDNEGEVFDWQCNIRPQISPQTAEFLKEAVLSTPHGISKVEITEKLVRNLPAIEIVRDRDIKVKLPNNGGVVIGSKKIHYFDKNGEWEHEISETPDFSDLHYKRIKVPIEAEDFFPSVLPGMRDYFVTASLTLRAIPLAEMHRRLGEIIQNYSVTEARVRTFVNLYFEIGKTYREEVGV